MTNSWVDREITIAKATVEISEAAWAAADVHGLNYLEFLQALHRVEAGVLKSFSQQEHKEN